MSVLQRARNQQQLILSVDTATAHNRQSPTISKIQNTPIFDLAQVDVESHPAPLSKACGHASIVGNDGGSVFALPNFYTPSVGAHRNKLNGPEKMNSYDYLGRKHSLFRRDSDFSSLSAVFSFRGDC